MIRVYVICEGQTEETFVTELLRNPFQHQNIFLTPILIGKPGHRGGNLKFDRLKNDVQLLLGDQTAYCTTFFDFYGLPGDFPGKFEATRQMAIEKKVQCIQNALNDRLISTISATALRRFIPYVQMHEFEALLFSDPQGLSDGIGRSDLAAHFRQIRNKFPSPEDINDSTITAPSKRIVNVVSRYQKPLYGVLAALEIGLDTIRRECALFDAWLKRIEHLRETNKES